MFFSSNVDDEEHQQLDETVLAVIKRLRDNNLLKKEDIREYSLLQTILFGDEDYFREKQFRFLMDLGSDDVDDAA